MKIFEIEWLNTYGQYIQRNEKSFTLTNEGNSKMWSHKVNVLTEYVAGKGVLANSKNLATFAKLC